MFFKNKKFLKVDGFISINLKFYIFKIVDFFLSLLFV